MGARSSQSRGPGLNKTDGHLLEYFRQTFGAGGGGNSGPSVSPVVGHTATGGVISDYTDGGFVYRSHVFTASGTFDVTALGNQGNTVEYLVVAGGGGGGGGYYGGGGGAGGLRTNLPGHPLATGNPSFTVAAGPTSYTVTVGGGGAFGWWRSNANLCGNSWDCSTGKGGYGGGGDGAPTAETATASNNGAANTGGGGGNGSTSIPNGGSGICIIRYTGDPQATGGTIVTTGGYTYHTFTASGTFTKT